MFLYVTSSKFKFKLKLEKLSKHPEWTHQAAVWAEGKWGYIRKLGVEKREEIINQMKDDFYIVTYGDQPIGMFALSDYEWKIDSKKIKEFKYFYIDETFRNLGIGSEVFRAAMRIAIKQWADIVVLDTLNPGLNKFYEKHGAAKVVAEGQLFGCPTSALIITLPERESVFSYRNLLQAAVVGISCGFFAYHVSRGQGSTENTTLTDAPSCKM